MICILSHGVGLEKHVDLPCAPPNGAELVCATYIDGTPTGKKSIDEEKCNEVQIEAEITSEASAGIGNLDVSGSKIGATRKVTSCFKVSTTIGENELKGNVEGSVFVPNSRRLRCANGNILAIATKWVVVDGLGPDGCGEGL